MNTTTSSVQPTPATETATRVVNLIDFHGLTLWVLRHQEVDYLYAKPLVDLAEVDWRGAKRTLQEPHNLILYGTKWLDAPVIAAEGGSASPTPKKILCVRLDRSRIYMARINTRLMESKGATEAAERLLALQIEWAEALHRYETDGVAYKRAAKEEQNQLINLLKARNNTTGAERQAITRMIHATFNDLGYPVAETPACPDAASGEPEPQGKTEEQQLLPLGHREGG